MQCLLVLPLGKEGKLETLIIRKTIIYIKGILTCLKVCAKRSYSRPHSIQKTEQDFYPGLLSKNFFSLNHPYKCEV